MNVVNVDANNANATGTTRKPLVLSPGDAAGEILRLDEPLSFWGGVDSSTGTIIDQRHPQVGLNVTGKVLVMERGRGSSSGSSVLAEAIRGRTGPAAIVMSAGDEIVALGAIVADEIYGIQIPVVVVGSETYASLTNGASLRVLAPDSGDVSLQMEVQP